MNSNSPNFNFNNFKNDYFSHILNKICPTLDQDTVERYVVQLSIDKGGYSIHHTGKNASNVVCDYYHLIDELNSQKNPLRDHYITEFKKDLPDLQNTIDKDSVSNIKDTITAILNIDKPPPTFFGNYTKV